MSDGAEKKAEKEADGGKERAEWPIEPETIRAAWLYLLGVSKRVLDGAATPIDRAHYPKILAALKAHHAASRGPANAAAAVTIVNLVADYIEELRHVSNEEVFDEKLQHFRHKLQRKIEREFGHTPTLELVDALLSARTESGGGGVQLDRFGWDKDPRAPKRRGVEQCGPPNNAKRRTVKHAIASILSKALSGRPYETPISQSTLIHVVEGPAAGKGGGSGRIVTEEDYLTALDPSFSYEEATHFVVSELWSRDIAEKTMERIAIAVIANDALPPTPRVPASRIRPYARQESYARRRRRRLSM